MKINVARALLRKNLDDMSLEQLQKHYVKIIDAWRWSKAQYGFKEAVENGFYKIMFDNGAQGFTPTDMWLTHQLESKLDEIYKLLNERT